MSPAAIDEAMLNEPCPPLLSTTVTVHSAVISSPTVTVIVAVPSSTPVTTPFSTVATSSSELSHVHRDVESLGVRVACNVYVPPLATSMLFLSNVTPVASGAETDIIKGFVGVISELHNS